MNNAEEIASMRAEISELRQERDSARDRVRRLHKDYGLLEPRFEGGDDKMSQPDLTAAPKCPTPAGAAKPDPAGPSEEDLQCISRIIEEWTRIDHGEFRPPMVQIIAAHTRAQVEQATKEKDQVINAIRHDYRVAYDADVAASIARELQYQRDLSATRRWAQALREAVVEAGNELAGYHGPNPGFDPLKGTYIEKALRLSAADFDEKGKAP